MFQYIKKKQTTLQILITSCGLFGISIELIASGLVSGPHIPAIVLSSISGLLLLSGCFSNGKLKSYIIGALVFFCLFGVGGLIGHLTVPTNQESMPAPLAPMAFSGLIILGSISLISRSSNSADQMIY